MKKGYLLIKCGYEGIEGLIHLTTDKEEIIKKINGFRNKIDKRKENFNLKLVELGIDKDNDEEVQKAMLDERVKYKEYSAFMCENPDQYCVQQWDGKAFKCCCKELGVEPENSWLY